MKISYEIGDVVSIIAGANAHKDGAIFDVKTLEDGTVKLVIVVSKDETVECYADQVILINYEDHMLHEIYKCSDKYYYALENEEGYWKWNSKERSFVQMGGTEERSAAAAKVVSRISRSSYDVYAKRGIPMDGSDFWFYDTEEQTYTGPMTFKDDVIRTRKGKYVELEDKLQPVAFAITNVEALAGIETFKKAMEAADRKTQKQEAKRTVINSSVPRGLKSRMLNDTQAMELYAEYCSQPGMTLRKIAKKYGISQPTAYRYVARIREQQKEFKKAS